MVKFSLQDLHAAILKKDVFTIKLMMFEEDTISPKAGFKTEGRLWDYKGGCPGISRENDPAWARVAKNVLGFHNNRGGILIFGIDDNDYHFVGTNSYVDAKIFNDKIRKYLGDSIWVDFHREFIQSDQSFLGIAVVPPRGPLLARFTRSSPKDTAGKRIFEKGGTAIRRKDSTYILSKAGAEEEIRKSKVGLVTDVFAVNSEGYRVLNPEYTKFVHREELCKKVMDGLGNRKTSIVSLTGIGGTGKTALATWATLQAFDRGMFNYIVSITAKDRELTTSGIQALKPDLTSYESLLDAILEVLECNDSFSSTTEKEAMVKSLLEDSNILLYVDNLETVDDNRIIEFLDEIPYGVKAIVTSRRSRVRVSVLPIEVEPFSDNEALEYVEDLSSTPGLYYLQELSEAERLRICNNCDNIPLAMLWATTRSGSKKELIRFSDSLETTQKRGEELLEFSYRRVYDAMNGIEKRILKTLSIFSAPIKCESIIIGAKISFDDFADNIDVLVDDVFVKRSFCANQNDYVYSILPTTKKFLLNDYDGILSEAGIRKRLSDFFDAMDVIDPEERVATREFRRGGLGSENALIELGKNARENGDISEAEKFFEQALERTPSSWQAARELAELYRHDLRQLGRAYQYYQRAIQNCPEEERAYPILNREYGIILRESGETATIDQAIEHLRIALLHLPHDEIAACALGQIYSRKGMHNNVIGIVEKHAKSTNPKTLRFALPILYKAYKATNDILKTAKTKEVLDKNRIPYDFY